MFNCFRRKGNKELWIASVKELREIKFNSYRILSQDEIKKEILTRMDEGARRTRFEKCRISKQDKKDLNKLGYTVKCYNDYDDAPTVEIEW